MAQWFVAAKKADFEGIGKKFNISPVLARIIRNRDITQDDDIRKYLYGDISELYDPGLLKGMDQAAEVLLRKIRQQKPVRVIGDYDADGICSAYILHCGLQNAGAIVDTAIPHRVRDGYGLNENLVTDAFEAGIDTIVTCDNGIAAAPQIAFAKEKGMTVIVTDHHEVPYEESVDGKRYILPPADAVIDPKQEGDRYPFKGICGGVVAFKVIQYLYRQLGLEQSCASVLDELLQMAAFATICDVMELLDENRLIVKYGLEHMQTHANIGVQALMEVNAIEGKKLSAYHIGFVLGPCMNATGRLDTAVRALELLQSRDRAQAVTAASELKLFNDSRKELTEKYLKEAIETVETTTVREDRILVVYLPSCHESLAGIIAGRLRERYYKPVFVLTKGEEEVKGSGRSTEAYHMYDEMTRVKELFTKYGGHKMAAGLSIREEDVDVFRCRINGICTLTQEDMTEKVHIDVPMPVTHVTMNFVKELELLEPFGNGNSKPVFAQKDMKFIGARIMGKNGNVVRFTAQDELGKRWEVMYFGNPEPIYSYITQKFGQDAVPMLEAGRAGQVYLSLTYYPVLNTWQGSTKLQIVMQQYR